MTSPISCRNDSSKLCDSACPKPGAGACGGNSLISLKESLERFESEAVHGSCDTRRYRCSYFSWGKGPPLVFIHGMSDLPTSFVMPMSRLADRFRCISYALPEGNGDGANLKRYAHEDLVADLFCLLDQLGIQRTYLFGSSLGSTIALAAMRAQPARVPRALLQGGFARRPLGRGEAVVARCARYYPGRMRHLPFRRQIRRRLHRQLFAGRPGEVWDYFFACTGATHARAVALRALMLHRLDLRPILPEVRQPVLLVCGDRDHLVGKQCEEELLRGLPLARRVEIFDCGHYPYFSHPEVLVEIARDFLTPPVQGDTSCRTTAAG